MSDHRTKSAHSLTAEEKTDVFDHMTKADGV